MMLGGVPSGLPFQALKAEARRRGYQVGIGATPGARVILQRHAKDRKALKFANRDEAVDWLRGQPEVSMRR